MRELTGIVIHCSATKPHHNIDVSTVRAWHKARGWRDVGYHFFIKLDGTVEKGRPIDEAGAHVSGFNADTVGICYAGGVNRLGAASDTRTEAQKAALVNLCIALVAIYPSIETIKGHRDYSPDLNGDGVIQPSEWFKKCPSFDAGAEYQWILKNARP